MNSANAQPTYRLAKAPERGQSSTEYLVVCAALALALGIGMVDDSSALRQLLNAFVLSYQKISFALSLP
jgi:hypothetical protein